jgi:hypothetical protein
LQGVERPLLHHVHVRGGSAFMTQPRGNNCKAHASLEQMHGRACRTVCGEMWRLGAQKERWRQHLVSALR